MCGLWRNGGERSRRSWPSRAEVGAAAAGLAAHSGFTRWKEHDAYQKAPERLLRDLKVEKA
jgi:hypothetical protein